MLVNVCVENASRLKPASAKESPPPRSTAPTHALPRRNVCTPRSKADNERTYRALFAAFPDIGDDVDSLIFNVDRVAGAASDKS